MHYAQATITVLQQHYLAAWTYFLTIIINQGWGNYGNNKTATSPEFWLYTFKGDISYDCNYQESKTINISHITNQQIVVNLSAGTSHLEKTFFNFNFN